MRSRSEERQLWVDALCINQVDDAEKSHQVALMSQIYSHTEICLAWLGDFEEESSQNPDSKSLDDLRTLAYGSFHERPIDAGPKITIPRLQAEKAVNFLKKLAFEDWDMSHFMLDENDPEPEPHIKVSHSEITALRMLVDLDWWNRIWTAQETILPPRLCLLCGTLIVDNDTIAYLSKPSQRHHGYAQGCCSKISYKGIGFWEAINTLCNNLRNRARGRPIIDAIHQFRMRRCSDPRDKIFALVGLSKAIESQLVDYSWSKKEVYIRYVRFKIVCEGSLCFLLRGHEVDRDKFLPSWVPDLCADVAHFYTAFFHYTIYNADGKRRKLDVEVSQEDELQVKGIKTDRIKSVGLRADCSKMAPLPIIGMWRSLLEQQKDLDLQRYPSGGSYNWAFWCTMVMGIWRVEPNGYRKAQPQDEAGIRCFLQGGIDCDDIGWMSRFFITEKGLMGIGSSDTQAGDEVFILFGGNMPFVLREINKVDRSGCYKYVGHSYVHGIMDGEAVQDDGEVKQVILL